MAVMAKPSKKNASLQAPAEAWSPEMLLRALKGGTEDDKVKAMRMAGILDSKGNLTKKYTNWGNKVTRTPNAEC
jgi:hypothetical protein